jgi:hypothetical protein
MPITPLPFRWPPRSQVVTVNFDFADGAARAGQEYVGQSGTLTFLPGTTNASISVVIKGDVADEPDKTFLVNLRDPVNATLARSQASITIVDDDAPTLVINDIDVNVGTNALATAVLTLTLSTPSPAPVQVDYFTSNLTASAGTDYEAQRGTIVFPPGTTAQPLRIPVYSPTVRHSRLLHQRRDSPIRERLFASGRHPDL